METGECDMREIERERFRERVASRLDGYEGKTLALRVSYNEIGLYGEENEELVKRKLILEGLSNDEGLDVIRDLISGAERRGYSQSLLSRFILDYGFFIPDKIKLMRQKQH